jgi:hypothetical protein
VKGLSRGCSIREGPSFQGDRHERSQELAARRHGSGLCRGRREDDRRVTPGPDAVAPPDQRADLLAELAVDVLHEAGELLGVLDP